jgi:hypothetical protein
MKNTVVIDTARWHEVSTMSAIFSLVLYGMEWYLDRQIMQDWGDIKTITYLCCVTVTIRAENDKI